MKNERTEIREKLRLLVRAKRVPFPAERGRLDAPPTHGVYVIFGPRGRVLHVGRTVGGQQGLRQRLHNHLHGQSSFTASEFGRNGDLLRNTHSFAYLEEANPRRRALLEACAIGHLCPKHLGLGTRSS